MTKSEEDTTQSDHASKQEDYNYNDFFATLPGTKVDNPFEFDAEGNLVDSSSVHVSQGGTATQPKIDAAYLKWFPRVEGEEQKEAQSTAPGTSDSRNKKPGQSATGSLLPDDYERPVTRSQSATTSGTHKRGGADSKDDKQS